MHTQYMFVCAKHQPYQMTTISILALEFQGLNPNLSHLGWTITKSHKYRTSYKIFGFMELTCMCLAENLPRQIFRKTTSSRNGRFISPFIWNVSSYCFS